MGEKGDSLHVVVVGTGRKTCCQLLLYERAACKLVQIVRIPKFCSRVTYISPFRHIYDRCSCYAAATGHARHTSPLLSWFSLSLPTDQPLLVPPFRATGTVSSARQRSVLLPISTARWWRSGATIHGCTPVAFTHVGGNATLSQNCASYCSPHEKKLFVGVLHVCFIHYISFNVQ